MSYHSGTIHAVRFSPSGLYLASGADDKIVCVYTLDANAPSHGATFGTYNIRHFIVWHNNIDSRITGTDEPPPTETWRSFRRLIGHDNDIQDLGWSHDSSILVSVGLDSKIVVWSGHTFERLKTLLGHQSHVKGITFDPANKYFATASDDRSIKIWRFTPPGPNAAAHDQVNNFQLEKTVTAPFVASPLTTYFRRCSWSPDGNHISAANSVNGPVNSVAIINRGSWAGDINLIGHEGPVEVSSFSPRLFRRDTNVPGHLSSVVACGGQDKALSIWITTLPRPLMITQDFTTKPISDLAWSPDGRILFVSSLDGSITALVFEHGELGHQLSLEENEKSLAKYGTAKRSGGIVDGTQSLILEEKARLDEVRGVEGRMGALMGHTEPHSAANEVNGDTISSETIPQTNGDGPTINGDQEPASGKNKEADNLQEAKLERLKSRVTITKDGKKRIAPLLVSTAGGQESTLPRAQLVGHSSTAQGNPNDAPQAILDLSKPFDGLPQGGMASLIFGNRRKYARSEGEEDDHVEKKVSYIGREGALPILSDTPNGLIPAKKSQSDEGQQSPPEWVRSAVVNPSLTTSQLRLAVPKVRSHILHNHVQLANANGIRPQSDAESTQAAQNAPGLIFEARNSISSREKEPCRIAVTRRGQLVWQDYLPRSALLMAGSRHFWAVACEDGSIYTWTPAGRRLASALVLESQSVILASQDEKLLCLTAVGMCYVWNMVTQTSPHPPVSLAPILDVSGHSLGLNGQVGPAVTTARLNSEGRIIITLSNGEGFTYSPTLYSWQRISEPWWATGSQYWNTTDATAGNIKAASTRTGEEGPQSRVSAGIIPFLERSTTRETLARGRPFQLQRLVKALLSREGFEGFESSISIAHLENRIAAAMTLGARDDFQVYLYMYAKRIGAEGLKTKVEELLRDILGGGLEEDTPDLDSSAMLRDPCDRHWGNPTTTLCGWPRRDLMRGVILLLGMLPDNHRQ